jgi:hypothetical protein
MRYLHLSFGEQFTVTVPVSFIAVGQGTVARVTVQQVAGKKWREVSLLIFLFYIRKIIVLLK